MRRQSILLHIAATQFIASPVTAQFGFSDTFTPAEFAARRSKVMERIGDGIAVIHGSAEIPGSLVFRQNNQFYYLTGVAVPRAVLIIDGKARTSTLFLPHRSEGEQRGGGPLLVPGDVTQRISGIEHVAVRDSVLSVLTRLAAERRPVFAPFGGEVRGASYVSHANAYDRANTADPLDGRPSREQLLVAKLRS